MYNVSSGLCMRFALCCVLIGLCYIYSCPSWASCQITYNCGCACAGNAGNVSSPPQVSDPDMHHGTCVSYVAWCMPESLTSDFLWSRRLGKRSRHSWRMRNTQFYLVRGPWLIECHWGIVWLPRRQWKTLIKTPAESTWTDIVIVTKQNTTKWAAYCK